jgi:hypothetical protein
LISLNPTLQWNLQVVDEEQGLVQFVNLAGNNYAGVSGEIDVSAYRNLAS